MANVDLLIPKFFPWETGKTIDQADLVKMAFDSADPGGWTKFGITLDTWKAYGVDKDGDGDIDKEDLAVITVDDYTKVLKERFWDKWKADLINNQSIAELLVDWVWASGKHGIIEPQKVLGVVPDGVVGSKTIAAINEADQAKLFKQLHNQRMVFIERIVLRSIRNYLNDTNPSAQLEELKDKTLLKFKRGWINRVNFYKFEP